MNKPRLLANFSIALLCGACSGLEIEENSDIASRSVLVDHEVTDFRSEAFLQEMVKEEHFTGVALVMKKDQIVHVKGYGSATNKKKNGVTTAFHVASITKQFTAAAILQLVEKGIVELDGSINDYLPHIYRSPKWNRVTIHHLLTHTSGVPDYGVTRDYYEVVRGFCIGNTVDGMVKEAMAKKLEFEPGTKASYSNLGYTLLGFVLENQSGTSYADYVKANLLDPMGMSSSVIHVIGHVPTIEEADGYRWSEEQREHVPDDIVSLPVTAPDGGLVTTLSDFVKWAGIYVGRKPTILNQQSIDKMTSPAIRIDRRGPRGTQQSIGYGLFISDDVISHEGYIVGFRSHFIVDREKELLVAVFSNNTANDPRRISTGLLEILDAPAS